MDTLDKISEIQKNKKQHTPSLIHLLRVNNISVFILLVAVQRVFIGREELRMAGHGDVEQLAQDTIKKGFISEFE